MSALSEIPLCRSAWRKEGRARSAEGKGRASACGLLAGSTRRSSAVTAAMGSLWAQLDPDCLTAITRQLLRLDAPCGRLARCHHTRACTTSSARPSCRHLPFDTVTIRTTTAHSRWCAALRSSPLLSSLCDAVRMATTRGTAMGSYVGGREDDDQGLRQPAQRAHRSYDVQ